VRLYDIFTAAPSNVFLEGDGMLKDVRPGEDERTTNTREFVAQRLLEAAHMNPVVVDVTSVARWMMEANPQEVFSLADFPNLAPPFEVAWFEHALPTKYNLGGELESFPENRYIRVANVARWWPAPGLSGGWEAWFTQLLYDKRNPGQHFGFGGASYFGVDRAGRARALMPTGDPVGDPDGDDWRIMAPSGVMRAPAERQSAFNRNFRSVVYPALMAVSLLHCKNVRTVEHATPPKVAAKRRKAGKPVGVTYKTLVIDGMKETLRTEGRSGENGLKKAMHICRGHFATYTEDKPLFGKITGTFWKPMHTRGSKKRGEVKKDYKVVAGDRKGEA